MTIMNYSFALQFFALVLLLISIALVPFVMRRDPVPTPSVVQMDMLPHTQWPGLLTRIGVMGLLTSFVVLLAACCLLLPV